MSISVTVVTTANRTLSYVQSDEAAIKDIFGSLRVAGQLFSQRTLIIGADTETQIIAPSSMTRIEIATQRDLGGYLPGELHLTKVAAQDNTQAPEFTDTHVSALIDFFFEGGDHVGLRFSGERPTNVTDRLLRITRLFEQPVLMYQLPEGGIGLMNPARMTRARVGAPLATLPAGAWRLQSAA